MNFKTDNGCPADAMACELFKCFIERVVGVDNQYLFVHHFLDLALFAPLGRYTLNVGNSEYAMQTAVFAQGRSTTHLLTCQHGLCLRYRLLR